LPAALTWVLLTSRFSKEAPLSAMGLIFLVVGVGLGVGCLLVASRTKRFLAHAREAQAEVIGLRQRLGDNHTRVYHPVLRYQTREGATHEVISSVGSHPPRHKEGDRIAILYNPERPEEVRIHTFFNVWLVALVLGGMGGLFVLVGGGLALLGGGGR
jgi:hypothetical protein